MNFGEALRASSREIRANTFRSTLSFAAISVGVASLLYTMGQIGGMREALAKNVKLQGPGRLSIEKKRNYEGKGLSEGLSSDDADAIRSELPDLFMVYPRSTKWGARLAYGAKRLELRVDAVTPDWRKREWVYEMRGRFLSEWDLRHNARVCVLVEPAGWKNKPFWAKFWMSEKPYASFIKRHDLLGRVIGIEDKSFRVIGVLKPPPMDLDPRWDPWDTPEALIPISAYQTHLPAEKNPRAVSEIVVDTGSEKTLAPRRRAIESILRRRHRGEEDFEIKDLKEEIEGRMEQLRKYVVAGIALGIVALLAGGVGIMNVTLATIFARVKEIGIRRSVGASRADILLQFVLEAALLGAAGGLAGVGLGAAGLQYLAKIGENELIKVGPLHAAAAVAVGAAVSALFAALPAYRASRLDPVEALRSE